MNDTLIALAFTIVLGGAGFWLAVLFGKQMQQLDEQEGEFDN